MVRSLQVSTLFAVDTQQPMVELRMTDPVVQLSVDEAVDTAGILIRAAKEAEADAFLVGWMRGNGFEEHHVVGLLTEFRQWREARIGGRMPTQVEWYPPAVDEGGG